MQKSTAASWDRIGELRQALDRAEAVVVAEAGGGH